VSAEQKGLGTSNVRIVDRAEAPLYPSSPKKKLNMVLALLIGLIGGTGLAFLFERLDDSIKNFDDVERYAGLPSLGAVPAFSPDGFPGAKSSAREKNRDNVKPDIKIKVERKARRNVNLNSWLTDAKRDVTVASTLANGEAAASSSRPGEKFKTAGESIDLITFSSPASAYSESYRTIRSSVLLSFADPDLKCIAVSSPLPQEGKTTTLSNLAVTLSQAGKKVLVVDSDLRKPRQHKIFKLLNVHGLSSYLAGTMDLNSLIKPTAVPNLFLINAGPIPPNPIELLGSEKMTALIGDLRKQFDYVLFDTPPLLAVTDGLVLGAKLDGLILVVWAERTSREALKRAREKLDMAKIKTLGVILNNLIIRKHDYYYRNQYYQYYGDKGDRP
jgi:capsular exopolysaccharide synthesis family protein